MPHIAARLWNSYTPALEIKSNSTTSLHRNTTTLSSMQSYNDYYPYVKIIQQIIIIINHIILTITSIINKTMCQGHTRIKVGPEEKLEVDVCSSLMQSKAFFMQCWSGLVVEYRTRNREVAGSTHTRSIASNLEQVANPLCAQADSASYPQRDGKWVVATATWWRPSVADWGNGVSASCTVGPTVR